MLGRMLGADLLRKKLRDLFDYRHEAVRRIVEEGRIARRRVADPTDLKRLRAAWTFRAPATCGLAESHGTIEGAIRGRFGGFCVFFEISSRLASYSNEYHRREYLPDRRAGSHRRLGRRRFRHRGTLWVVETMPHTTQCTQCGIRLNVPEGAAGRRLKCPKCGTRFFPDAPEPQRRLFGDEARHPGCVARLEVDVSAIRSNPDLPASSGDPRKGGMARPTCPRPREICATRSTCHCWSMTSPPPIGRDRSGTRRHCSRKNPARRGARAPPRRGREPDAARLRRGGPGRDVALQLLRPQPGDRSAHRPG